ncbi:hypothetical protein C8J56DRAFT_910377 [Mycena floridula]|nr:hypothetical protein C8J56DRAFT_910377 [Mycena floridula]
MSCPLATGRPINSRRWMDSTRISVHRLRHVRPATLLDESYHQLPEFDTNWVAMDKSNIYSSCDSSSSSLFSSPTSCDSPSVSAAMAEHIRYIRPGTQIAQCHERSGSNASDNEESRASPPPIRKSKSKSSSKAKSNRPAKKSRHPSSKLKSNCRVPCDMCPKETTFNRISDLKRHQRTVHKKEPPVPCPACQKLLSRRDVVWRHLQTSCKGAQ